MARTPKVVEDRGEQIIDAAMRVFARKGFTRATNKDIAQEAGITPGLIYHYFASKEALLKAIIERHSPVQIVRSLPPQMLALPPETMLRLMMQQMLSMAEGEQFLQLMRIFLPEVIHNPNLSPVGLPFLQEATKFLEDYLRGQMEKGVLAYSDAPLAAQVVLGSVMGMVLRRNILNDPTVLQYTHEQIIESLVATVLQGLLPR